MTTTKMDSSSSSSLSSSLSSSSESLALTPEVLEKLETISATTVQSNPTINSKIRPIPSKSADTKQQKYEITPEKSISLTLAERRNNNIPASLKLYTSSAVVVEEEEEASPQKSYSLQDQENLITKIVKKLSLLDSSTSLVNDVLQDGSFWQEFIQTPMDVKKRLELLDHEFIPQEIRDTIWKAICQPSLKIQIMYDQLVKETGPYDALIEKEQTDDAVTIRILKAYSIYDARVGYHASLAKLLSPLLLNNMPENEVFSVFVRLMETYDMRNLYMLNMDGLSLLLQQFKTLFTQTCPKLETHFSKLSVQPSMYATQWFLTLFSTNQNMRLYDLVWLQGAVETMIRTSIWILQSNETALLNMNSGDQIIEFLSSSAVFNNNRDINDILSMNRLVSKFDLLLQQEEKTKKTPIKQQQRKKTNSSSNSSNNNNNNNNNNNTVPLLQQQVEDLVNALSQLQKEYTALSQDNMKLRMHEMDQEAVQLKLVKRNTVLEKRVKKYKVKLANASTTVTTDEPNKTNHHEPEPAVLQQHQKSKRQNQFSSFVASLRDTGDFGALIAGALASPTQESDVVVVEDLTVKEQQQQPEQEEEAANQKKLDAALQNVTSELVAVKLDHFETCQRYETLLNHCQDLNTQIQSMQESQTALYQKVIYLESELEDVVTERDQIFADQGEVLAMAMVAKKTSAELQLEKMALAKEVERLEGTVKELQEEKQAFFMPRGTFSEEVFAAHHILFGSSNNSKKQPQKDLNRRHTLQLGILQQQDEDDEYKSKFVESELRCRELEKYLAETKVKLAEFESSMSSGTPRGSLQQPRRAASTKRNSTASLSMLANRTSTPTSPRERRESTESYASSTTSLTSISTNSKRSSMYSRIWNAFGSPPATPTTTINTTIMKNPIIMCDEPQIIQ